MLVIKVSRPAFTFDKPLYPSHRLSTYWTPWLCSVMLHKHLPTFFANCEMATGKDDSINLCDKAYLAYVDILGRSVVRVEHGRKV